jgi:hypothetical protein
MIAKRAKSKLALILVTIALITTTGVVVFRSFVRCDSTEGARVRSPNGKWVVTSTSRACPAGPLSVTNYDVFVTLRAQPAAGSRVPAPVHIFDSDDAAEPPNLTWASTNELRLELKEEGAIRTSKHEVENIRIEYVVPKWIWDSLGSIESDRLRDDRQSKELFNAGKISSNDLRVSLELTAAVAQQRTKFREWVLANATVEENPR